MSPPETTSKTITARKKAALLSFRPKDALYDQGLFRIDIDEKSSRTLVLYFDECIDLTRFMKKYALSYFDGRSHLVMSNQVSRYNCFYESALIDSTKPCFGSILSVRLPISIEPDCTIQISVELRGLVYGKKFIFRDGCADRSNAVEL